MSSLENFKRMNRTLQDKITCAMKISAIKSKKRSYGFFLVSKINLIPRHHLE